MSAYGDSALDRECRALARLVDGRHTGLCSASVRLGQLVGTGELDRGEAERALIEACHANGYFGKRGANATKSTISTGLDLGEANPRRKDGRQRPAPRPPVPTPVEHAEASPNPSVDPLWLWRQRQPIAGSVAELYLRRARGYAGLIPSTLAFLPARGGHKPALMAAFGIATEPEPGEIAIADADVRAVQLVKLKPDGTKADSEPDNPNKITIGKGALCSPIVLAPPNDLLGLAICEGLEDALSVHEATNLGAWAAGGWSRMAALADAVPDYIDFVTIVADRDPDGIRGAQALAEGLSKRRMNHRISYLEPPS